jgi:hypothetical protein
MTITTTRLTRMRTTKAYGAAQSAGIQRMTSLYCQRVDLPPVVDVGMGRGHAGGQGRGQGRSVG